MKILLINNLELALMELKENNIEQAKLGLQNVINKLKNYDSNFVENRVRQGRSLPDVACGRIKECEHFLGLTEKLSWLKESEEHDLFVSMIKMRIEYLKQDDSVKKAMTDTLKELINESNPSA